jgi:hypothetical protein
MKDQLLLYFSHVLDRMVVGFTTTYAIRTTDVSSNPTRVIQHYVIKFVNDVRQVCGFLQVLHHDITEILLNNYLHLTVSGNFLMPSPPCHHLNIHCHYHRLHLPENIY